MNNKRVVLACLGDAASTAAIQRAAESADVIAVAFDFGGAVTLADLREMAKAAGASRCHALDVREEFARELLVPALRSASPPDPERVFSAAATPFVARRLREIASLEEADCIIPECVPVPPRAVSPRRPNPLHLDIRFEDGVPVAINGVDMALTELMESIEIITGEPALVVLHQHILSSQQQQIA